MKDRVDPQVDSIGTVLPMKRPHRRRARALANSTTPPVSPRMPSLPAPPPPPPPPIDEEDSDQLPQLVPARYVRLATANIITGYSVKAMYRKIQEDVWREQREWIRAPDGHILLDRLGYERWAISHYTYRPNKR